MAWFKRGKSLSSVSNAPSLPPRRPLAMALEPRVMFDGAAVATVAAFAPEPAAHAPPVAHGDVAHAPAMHRPAAVWADDDLVVSRIRGDFADVESVTIVTRQASGDEISRIANVAVRPGQREILNAFSAAQLRDLPPTRVRVTVSGRIGGDDRTISEYTLEHAGAFDRRSGDRAVSGTES